MDELMLTDLINVELLQQIQDAFADLTGFAALTADKYGTAVTKGSNFTDFCTLYTRNSWIGKKRCEECDKNGAIMTQRLGKSCAYFCHAGLMDFAAPIMANNEMVGSFIGGQVLTSPPDLDKFRRIAKELDIDPELYVEAVKKVKIVDRYVVDRATKALHSIANVLSRIAFNAYELHQANIELEKAMRAKSDFLANMSHEIRTPMNAVLGMTEMALREEMAPAARDYMYQIKASGKNLLVIINDILDFSKIESGKMEIVPVTYEPHSMINDIASIVCSRIGDKDIEFILDIDPQIPSKLTGDNVRIQQILINLLNNAVKFTNSGEVKLSITGEKNGDNINLKCCVADTGIGIKQEDLGKLFQSFQQVDSKRNRNIEGTGLGLQISRQLLELMGGAITLESVYGKGTKFMFNIPQKIVSDTPMITREPPHDLTVMILINNKFVKEQVIADLKRINIKCEDAVLSENILNSSLDFDFLVLEKQYYTEEINSLFLSRDSRAKCIVIDDYNSRADIVNPNVKTIKKPVYFINLYAAMNIIDEYVRGVNNDDDDFSFIAPEASVLIVDDNPINLTVARGLIEPLKMNVDVADSANAAIEMIKKTQYDIVFMDHMMPEVDGVEATHIIRRLMPSYDSVPIIALTANAVDGAKEMFLREGMNDFVSKPIDLKEITTKIKKWLPLEKIEPVTETAEEEKSDGDELVIKGLNIENAVKLLGSKNLYMTVLRDYYIAIDKKYEVVKTLYEKEDWRNYTIEVHSLKSTSRQIGAEELSALAFELEMAGNNGNIDLIKEKTDTLLKMYRDIQALIAPVFPDINLNQEKQTIDLTQVIGFLSELRQALDDFDTLAIDEVIEKMSAFVYGDYEETFEKLRTAAEECDIDACAEIADFWGKDIAQLYINR